MVKEDVAASGGETDVWLDAQLGAWTERFEGEGAHVIALSSNIGQVCTPAWPGHGS